MKQSQKSKRKRERRKKERKKQRMKERKIHAWWFSDRPSISQQNMDSKPCKARFI